MNPVVPHLTCLFDLPEEAYQSDAYLTSGWEPSTAMLNAHRAECKLRCLKAFNEKPRQPRIGNAAIRGLGQLPHGTGVPELTYLRTKLRDRSALKLIASSIEAAAKSAGMTVDDLEDLAVPTGGLDADGTRRETFGEVSNVQAVAPVGGQ